MDINTAELVVGAVLALAGLGLIVTGVTGHGRVQLFGNTKAEGPVGLCVLVIGAVLVALPYVAKPNVPQPSPPEPKIVASPPSPAVAGPTINCSNNSSKKDKSPVVCSGNVTVN